jgi:hypothetical protein
MKKGIDGFIKAIMSTIFGIVISIAAKEIVSNLMVNEILGIIGSLGVFAISLYAITSKMKYWGILYTIGWITGLGLMYYSMASIIEWYEIILYLGISGIILYGKLKKKI